MPTHTANLPWTFGPLDWIPAAERESISRSLADESERPIGLRVFLEDPRARTMHIWATLPEQTEYHVPVDGKSVDMWVLPYADSNLVDGFQLGTYATSANAGFLRCKRVAMATLSVWSFQLQRPVAIRETRIEDPTNKATWVVRPQAQEPIKLNDVTASLAAENAIGSLLALFREGMASTQPQYRFLCFYKILDAWKSRQGPFKQTDDALKAKGLGPRNTKALVLTEDMFAGKWPSDHYRQLIGAKFTICVAEMKDARDFVAHPFRETGAFISLDHPHTLAHFSDLANVAERMAIEILSEEIRLLATTDNTSTTQRMAQSLTHPSWAPAFFQNGAAGQTPSGTSGGVDRQ